MEKCFKIGPENRVICVQPDCRTTSPKSKMLYTDRVATPPEPEPDFDYRFVFESVLESDDYGFISATVVDADEFGFI